MRNTEKMYLLLLLEDPVVNVCLTSVCFLN